MGGFWVWLLSGSDKTSSNTSRNSASYARPGVFKLFNVWSIINILISILIVSYIQISLEQIAISMLLPAAGVFVGISFAWGANAHALLQSTEIEKLSQYKDGGYIDYVYTFQMAILILLITITLWTLAGIGLFSKLSTECRTIITIFMFSITAIALRECWHIVVGSSELLIVRYNIRNKDNNT